MNMATNKFTESEKLSILKEAELNGMKKTIAKYGFIRRRITIGGRNIGCWARRDWLMVQIKSD